VFDVVLCKITPDKACPDGSGEHRISNSEDVLPSAFSLILLKILFKFNQTETPVTTKIMIHAI
jgi:hypothetical protein